MKVNPLRHGPTLPRVGSIERSLLSEKRFSNAAELFKREAYEEDRDTRKVEKVLTRVTGFRREQTEIKTVFLLPGKL